ncbi:MAG: hypothetical protein KAS21_07215 [Candidatus Aminicenantes bacterium]|nr:hypothetical protein [Candidatus Aminicenantes bacterium]
MDNSDKLSSWKEIANYLDVEIRTCQRWEREAELPVHRYTKTSHSRVFTTRIELDKWLNRSNPLNEKESNSNFKFKNPLIFLLIILAIVPLLFMAFHANENPVNFKIIGSELIILNSKGDELWRYDTEVENLWLDNKYRNHFQHKYFNGKYNKFPKIIIKDIDNDKKNEVLFGIRTEDKTNCGEIYLFDHKGKVLWNYKLGKEMQYGKEIYSGDYAPTGIDIYDLNNDGKNEIIIISEHLLYFPTEFIVLNLNGEEKGSYWNSGRIADYAFHDLNNDGIKEVILAGMNNEYNKGCLTILNSDKISGFSPQLKDNYKYRNWIKGSEKYYLLLPRTIIDKMSPSRTYANNIIVLKNGSLSIKMWPSGVYFEFDNNFNILSVNLSDAFMNKMKTTQEFIKNEFSAEEYVNDIKKGIQYFNGKEWVPEPASSNPIL